MDLWNWILRSLYFDSWGVTPISLVAPVGLLTFIGAARRFVRVGAPNVASGDLAGVAFVAVILGVAFLWIFAGLGLLDRSFR